MGNMIKNDISSLRSLNQLNKNSNLLAKTLQKVSSGMKINSAADNASAYSISERMRVQIRALNQCSDNTKAGADMLSVAEGAVDNQIDLIKRMKEIALDAANDTNTDVDRATMQKEVNSRMMELNNISYSTQYNGRQLLNGTVPGQQVTQFNGKSGVTPNTTPVITESTNTVSTTPYSLPCYLPANNFVLPSPIEVYDPNNSQWVQDAAGKTYNVGDTVYDGTSAHNAYTVVADPNTGAMSILDSNGVYQEIGTSFMAYNEQLTAVPFANVTVGSQYSSTQAAPGNTNYTIGTLPDGTVVAQQQGAVANFYDFVLPRNNLPAALDQQGFSLLCDACEQFMCVQFDASMPAGSGAYYKDPDPNSESECYIIGINGLTTLNDIYDAMEQGLNSVRGQAAYAPHLGRHDADITFYTDANGDKRCYITKVGQDLDLYDGIVGKVETIGGKRPRQDLVIQGDTTSSQYTTLHMPNTTLDILFPAENSDWDIEPTDEDYPNPWPKGYEEDRTWPPSWGEDYINSTSLETKRKRLYREETWPYPVKGAISTGSCVSTQEKAMKFVDSLDQALKYLVNAATTLGAQKVRMGTMNDNITTSHENTTAAESVLRDADMAKEMTDYTRYNVLSQSAQSMLAQANQNLGSSLDLLK